jgi:NUMOD4 motif
MYNEGVSVLITPAEPYSLKGANMTPLQNSLPQTLEWRPIPGFPEYEICEDSRIRRLVAARGPYRKFPAGYIRKPWKDKQGYYHIKLRTGNSQAQNRRVQITLLGGE